jgi:excinuclease ABC subunit C
MPCSSLRKRAQEGPCRPCTIREESFKCLQIPEPVCVEPLDPELPERLKLWKGSAGVYLLRIDGAEPHLASSGNLERRLRRLLLNDTSGLLGRLRARVRAVDCWPTGSKLESSLLLYMLARRWFPDRYWKVLRLRAPAFVGMADPLRFPRLETSSRVADGIPQFGPFLTRAAAQRYEQEVTGLFQLRRCTETLAPHPDHPGCIYGEMNQCLRPCQVNVSSDEYRSEAVRVEDLIRTNGRSALAHLSGARERASEEMDFEQAAHIHRRIEKIRAAAALRDPAVQEIGGFQGVALTRAAGERKVALWPVRNACWQDPILFEIPAEDSRAKSLDLELRELLTERLKQEAPGGDRLEHLALFARWYYSSYRDGEWFPFEDAGRLNYRKLVREISKMLSNRAGKESSAAREGNGAAVSLDASAGDNKNHVRS